MTDRIGGERPNTGSKNERVESIVRPVLMIGFADRNKAYSAQMQLAFNLGNIVAKHLDQLTPTGNAPELRLAQAGKFLVPILGANVIRQSLGPDCAANPIYAIRDGLPGRNKIISVRRFPSAATLEANEDQTIHTLSCAVRSEPLQEETQAAYALLKEGAPKATIQQQTPAIGLLELRDVRPSDELRDQLIAQVASFIPDNRSIELGPALMRDIAGTNYYQRRFFSIPLNPPGAAQ